MSIHLLLPITINKIIMLKQNEKSSGRLKNIDTDYLLLYFSVTKDQSDFIRVKSGVEMHLVNQGWPTCGTSDKSDTSFLFAWQLADQGGDRWHSS